MVYSLQFLNLENDMNLRMRTRRYFFNLCLVLSIINLWILGSFYRSTDIITQPNLDSFVNVKRNSSDIGDPVLNVGATATASNISALHQEEFHFSSTTRNIPVPLVLHGEKEFNFISASISTTPGPVFHQEKIDFSSAATMPVLWGSVSGNKLGPSPTIDRMVLLDSWINYLSDDSRLHKIESKTLMIYEGGIKRWNGESNLNTDKAQFCNTKCKYIIGPEDMNKADGVLFIRDWFYNSDNVNVPENKFKILSFLESPRASRGDFRSPNTIVASYNRGSDIVIPYGKWVTTSKNVTGMAATENRNYAAGKTKMAAAFTSNCGTSNNRMLLIKSLQDFVSVDVYGACGKFKCPRSTSKDCFEKLKKDYKFYLAFENANCRDYVTEKLFLNAYANDVIPVVLGGHPSDYKALAPPHSYIHVEDFDTPEELANYLKRLASNDTLYNEYFKWKDTGVFYSRQYYASTLCRMCAMIHYADYTKTRPPNRKNETWSTFDRCLPTSKWYWEKED